MTRKQLCKVGVLVSWISVAGGWGQTIPSDGRALEHVFPVFADGRFNDGTFYRSSLHATTVVPETAGSCETKAIGMTTTMVDPDGNTYTLGTDTTTGLGGLGAWGQAQSQGTEPFESGYLTMKCTALQTAQVTYSFYAPDGAKLSEATVFSSAPGTRLQLFADQREGARLGLAIVNNTASPVAVQLLAFGLTNAPPVTSTGTIPAMSNVVRFLDELMPNAPRGQVGIVQLRAAAPISAIGLRFTGAVFATIPASVLIP